MGSFIRLLAILIVCYYYRLDLLINRQLAPWPLSLWLALSRWLPTKRYSPGVRLRMALERLGPIFIKFGQLLSTRRDLLPEDITQELGKLQDQVPAFSTSKAREIVTQALACDIDECFSRFDNTPLASASLAQVHTAQLKKGGHEVVVKILRPDVHTRIKTDLALLQWLARIGERWSPSARLLRLVEVCENYQTVLNNELDLLQEARNTIKLKKNFHDSPSLYVPEVFSDYSNAHVLVMEKVSGLHIDEPETLANAGVNLRLLAEEGMKVFFTQVFQHNFFHADMHPGNLFINIDNPRHPSFIVVDCAVIGHLSDYERYFLAYNLAAIIQRRYQRVAELHIESGWVPPDTSVAELTQVIHDVCEPLFEAHLKDISIAGVMATLFAAAQRFNMHLQPSLVLLQKTLFSVEGLARQLYPQINLLHTAQPILEQWMWQEYYSPRKVLKRLSERLIGFLEPSPPTQPKPMQTKITPQHSRPFKPLNWVLLGVLLTLTISLPLMNFNHVELISEWRTILTTAFGGITP